MSCGRAEFHHGLLARCLDPGLRARPPISPYVGIGWRSTKERGIGYAFDLGASHLGVADVSVTVDSDLPIDLIPTGGQPLQEFLDGQEREIEEEAEDYQVYPVVRLQLFYRF